MGAAPEAPERHGEHGNAVGEQRAAEAGPVVGDKRQELVVRRRQVRGAAADERQDYSHELSDEAQSVSEVIHEIGHWHFRRTRRRPLARCRARLGNEQRQNLHDQLLLGTPGLDLDCLSAVRDREAQALPPFPSISWWRAPRRSYRLAMPAGSPGDGLENPL